MHRPKIVRKTVNFSPERAKLGRLLTLHGFEFAAKELNERIDFQQAIESWSDYPACMARYPARFVRRLSGREARDRNDG